MIKIVLLTSSLFLASSCFAEGVDHSKGNHGEEMGGHALYEAQNQKNSPSTAKKTEQKEGLDRGKDNHEEGLGGHGLYEAQKSKPLSKEALKKKKNAEKDLDRGKDNHEEGVGGHGLYEATKK